jgi:hypothetical protein
MRPNQALRDPAFRTLSWQSLISRIAAKKELTWLTDALREKHGLTAEQHAR